MTRKFTFTILAMLFAILGPGAKAWGQTTASVELCTSWNATLAYATAYTHDYTIDNLNGGTATMTLGVQGVFRQAKADTYFQMNKKDGYFKNTTKLPGKITKIETTWSAAKGPTKCYFAINAEATSDDETVTVTAAASVTYTPPTDADYYFFNIDVKTGSGSAQMTSCKVYYEAKPAHTLTLSATNGSITAMNGETVIESGDNVEEGAELDITATANDWYKFSGWNVSGTGSTLGSTTANPTTFTMGTANATLTATFADCVVTVNSNNEFWGIALYDDESHTISTLAEDDYRISTTAPYTINPANAATLTAGEDGEYIVSGVKDQDVEITINFEALPSVAYTVTFNAGTNGTCSTTELTETSPGAGVTLPEVTPNTGYQFVGWATTNTATEADAGVAGETYNPIENITLYAVYNQVYTITWSVNGAPTTEGYPTTSVVEGEGITTLPTTPASISGMAFQGWTATQIATSSATAPTDLFTDAEHAPAITANTTFYAVFAEENEGDVTWNLANDIAANDVIIIATNKNYNSTMKTAGTISSNLMSCTASTFNSDKTQITSVADGTLEFTLGGNSTSGWTLQNGTNYLGMSGDKKVALSSTSSTWSISISSGVATVSQTYNSKSYSLQYNYNNGNDRFTGYTSGQTAISLYKKTQEITYTYYTNVVVKQLTSIELSGDYPTEFWKGETFNHDGMTVTAHYENADDENVTDKATFTGYDMATAGEQTVTVTYEGKTETYSITVKTIANTQETAYTIAQAIDIIEAGKDLQSSVYVAGIISQIDEFNSQYHNMTYWIEDESTETEFEVYRGKNLNNTDFNDENDIVIRANVIIYGKITKYNSTYEFSQGNYLVSYTAPQSYGITLNQSTGGTISADKETAAAGETVTITIELASGYTLATLTGAAFNETVDPALLTYTFTMPAEEVTISATFNAVPTYTISFATNGIAETEATIVVNQGDAIGTLAEPTGTNIPNGYTFRGWNAGEVALTNVEPTYITVETVPTDDMTLYAVFAIAETVEEVGQKTFVLTKDDFNGTSYGANNDSHTKDGITYTSYQVMQQNNVMQWQKNAGYIYNETAMKVTSISITKTDGTFTVYEGSEKHPTETITNNESGVYTFKNESDRYFSICVGNATGKVSNITVTYERITSSTTYSNFCTTVKALSGTITQSDITANTAYYISGVTTINSAVEIAALTNTNPANLVIEDGGQLIHHNAGVAATVKKSINGYTNAQGNDGYYLIANPTDNATVAHLTDNDYDLYTFDPEGDGEGNEWINKHSSPAVANGTGYLYASRGDVTLQFAGELLPAGSTDKSLTYAEEGTGIDFPGFNLIGNPFACNAYVMYNEAGLSTYRLNAGGSELVAVKPGTPIAPCEGFFVEAEEDDQTVVITTEESEVESSALSLTVSQNRGSVIDRAIVSFNGSANLHKFMLNPSHTNLSIAKDGETFAAVSSETKGELPVSFKAETTGTYTISVNTENVTAGYIHLIDNMTGTDVDLLATPSYTFIGSPRDNENRFTVKFEVSYGQDGDGDEHFAYQNGSELVVNGEGTLQIFDVLGRVVISEEVHGQTVNVGGLNTGAYIVRLTGESVKTQKIVVR